VLSRVKGRPLLFAGEAVGSSKAPRNILRAYYDLPVFGQAATRVRDVEGIALLRTIPEPVGTKICSFKTADGKPLPDVTMRLVQTAVEVYDRRSGALVHEKVFPPDSDCPMFFIVVDKGAADSLTPLAAIDAWLRSLVKATR